MLFCTVQHSYVLVYCKLNHFDKYNWFKPLLIKSYLIKSFETLKFNSLLV